MKKNNIIYSLLAVIILTPSVSFAALDGLRGLLIELRSTLNLLVPLIFGLSLLYFFWGLSQFILKAGDAKTRDDGKNKMVWGIVALFVFVSIYGILNYIGETLEIETNISGTTPPPGRGSGSGGSSSI